MTIITWRGSRKSCAAQGGKTIAKSAGGYESLAFVAEFYDHIEGYCNRPDVDFFVDAATQCKGPVLEIGCGTGRVLIPTARAGINIVGLDLSRYMLDVCRQRLLREPEEVRARVQLLEQDMRDFELGRVFKLVTTPFRPFQHLVTVDEQRSCLGCIHRHLADDGRLILDIFNPYLKFLAQDNVGCEMGDEPEFVMSDGRRVLRRFRLAAKDPYNQVNQVEMIYYVTHPDGGEERLVHSFPMRYLFRYEAEHLLARCGFHLEQLYADFDRSPYGSKYPGELIMVARKADGGELAI